MAIRRGGLENLTIPLETMRYHQVKPSSGTVTNLLSKSQAFDDAAWTKNQTTISADSTTAPDSTSTADTVTNSATDTDNVSVYQQVTTGTGTYTFSLYLKSGGGSPAQWVAMRIQDGIPTFFTVWFDIINGVVGTVNSGATGEIQPVGSGWYRCIVKNVTINTTNPYCLFDITQVDNSHVEVNSASVYAWGAQLETGSSAGTYSPNL